uniref:Uncharacterized protein n=1 Tax=Acrobeloides nanus TaxID=290746 RepID=A0A914CIQ8_9BILA
EAEREATGWGLVLEDVVASVSDVVSNIFGSKKSEKNVINAKNVVNRAEKIVNGAKNVASGEDNIINDAKDVVKVAENVVNGAKDVVNDAENIVNGDENNIDENNVNERRKRDLPSVIDIENIEEQIANFTAMVKNTDLERMDLEKVIEFISEATKYLTLLHDKWSDMYKYFARISNAIEKFANEAGKLKDLEEVQKVRIFYP